jgi:hypothetical protein
MNPSPTDTLEVIVNSVYDLEGDAGSIARKYIIPASAKITLGCSHMCFDGTPYEFTREIVGSKVYVEAPL